MRGIALVLVWLAGCASHAVKPPGEVWGELVDRGAPIPEFSVVNSDGQVRTRVDLLGHPTVVWFFPVAGTPG